MNEKMPINVNKEKVNFSVFSEHFPGSEIKEITADEIPENVMKYFESKSAQFILPDDYKPGNFEKFFIISHADGKQTYLAQQTKTYDNDDAEELTYFVDINDKTRESRSELRFNIKCKEEDIEYFKGKPFVGWLNTEEDVRRMGLGTRMIFIMNAYSQMVYSLPLYSDTVISPEAKKMFEKLVQEGKAEKFKEGLDDRYVLRAEKN